MKTFNKADIIELLSSMTVIYMVNKAVFETANETYGCACAIPKNEFQSDRYHTIRKIKLIRVRARKLGISEKCLFAIDNKAHAIAHNFYI